MIGRTRSITYTVDVIDSFFDGRGQLEVSSDRPDIRAGQEITVGKGHKGRVRVMVAVPDVAELGMYELRVVLDGWLKASRGMGPTLEHSTKLELVEDIPGQGSGGGKPTTGSGSANGGPSQGNNVALRWSNHEQQENWERTTVGEVIQTPGHVLAESRPEYKELSALGDAAIPTVLLNEEYPHLKKYLESRSKKLETLNSPKDRYAVGVGVALILLQRDIDRRAAKRSIDPGFVATAQETAARSVLAVLPAFDELAREAGLDGEPIASPD